MLLITRKVGEAFHVGDDIRVVVVAIEGSRIRLGIDAPREVPIWRDELTPWAPKDGKEGGE